MAYCEPEARQPTPAPGWGLSMEQRKFACHLHIVCIPVKGGINLPAPEVASWNYSLPRPGKYVVVGMAAERGV